MAARASGNGLLHLPLPFSGQVGRAEDQNPPEAGGVGGAGAGADEGLARPHFANHDGTPVGLEGQHRALDGVLLAPHRGAQQPGQLEAVLRGPVQGRVGLHHSLGDGFLEGVGLSYRLRVRVY